MVRIYGLNHIRSQLKTFNPKNHLEEFNIIKDELQIQNVKPWILKVEKKMASVVNDSINEDCIQVLIDTLTSNTASSNGRIYNDEDSRLIDV